MKKLVVALVAMMSFSQFAHATLINRGKGLIYDDSTNLTWMQDANYAQTSGYTGEGVDPYGRFTWLGAINWASNLVFGGYDDWRLPTTIPANGGYGQTGSELGHMFYISLMNKGACDIGYSCGARMSEPGIGLLNKGPFSFNDHSTFWTQTPAVEAYDKAWVFATDIGFEGTTPISGSYLNAWAVRDGDSISIPEPSPMELFAIGLLCFAATRRSALSNRT